LGFVGTFIQTITNIRFSRIDRLLQGVNAIVHGGMSAEE
jgi:hypothetical protein